MITHTITVPVATSQRLAVNLTQAQEHVYDIEKLYLNAANNVCQFIYIENQYFRWGPLAEKIKQVAERQTSWGRDPAQHNAIHLFVITNDTSDGIGRLSAVHRCRWMLN